MLAHGKECFTSCSTLVKIKSRVGACRMAGLHLGFLSRGEAKTTIAESAGVGGAVVRTIVVFQWFCAGFFISKG